MADALTHLYGAIDAIKFVTDGAGIGKVEIRVADERDARKLITFLKACDSTRMLLASPIDIKGHEFTINDVKITWPQ